MKTQHAVIGLVVLALCWSTAVGQNYQLLQSFTSSGGSRSTSASYENTNTLGQPAIGEASSASYQQGSGFWYQFGPLQDYFSSAYAVADGWNMISLPQTVNDYRKNTLYPTATSSAFAYGGGYQAKDTLKNGVGYWLKFAGIQNVSVIGIPRTRDTIPVADKWNMKIGRAHV